MVIQGRQEPDVGHTFSHTTPWKHSRELWLPCIICEIHPLSCWLKNCPIFQTPSSNSCINFSHYRFCKTSCYLLEASLNCGKFAPHLF